MSNKHLRIIMSLVVLFIFGLIGWNIVLGITDKPNITKNYNYAESISNGPTLEVSNGSTDGRHTFFTITTTYYVEDSIRVRVAVYGKQVNDELPMELLHAEGPEQLVRTGIDKRGYVIIFFNEENDEILFKVTVDHRDLVIIEGSEETASETNQENQEVITKARAVYLDNYAILKGTKSFVYIKEEEPIEEKEKNINKGTNTPSEIVKKEEVKPVTKEPEKPKEEVSKPIEKTPEPPKQEEVKPTPPPEPEPQPQPVITTGDIGSIAMAVSNSFPNMTRDGGLDAEAQACAYASAEAGTIGCGVSGSHGKQGKVLALLMNFNLTKSSFGVGVCVKDGINYVIVIER